ncbi:hypothetical protein [Mycobacterium gordonae]|nr:hypothetical protein [Mycobacterium gordonae]
MTRRAQPRPLRHLRQTTPLSLEQVAAMVGYGSPSALRQAMGRE